MQRKRVQVIIFFALVVSLACNNPLQTYLSPKPGAVSAPVSITAIAAGGAHTCALTSSGGVKCWGGNSLHALGDGTTNDSSIPVDVIGLADATAIGAGGDQTCALTSGGGVKCWGRDATTPTDVSGLTSGVAAIAVGQTHACALTSGGGVKCWGANDAGQLGDGTSFPSYSQLVDGGGLTSGVRAIAVGYRHTCAVTDGGGVKCWGWNEYGQLGDGTTTTTSMPVDVSGLTDGVLAVVAGYGHTCALTNAGALKCWGGNRYGQLGDGTTDNSNTPVDVSGLTSGITAMASGEWHTCALTSSGGVKCWGGGRVGMLGDGSETAFGITPVDVSGLTSGVIAITAIRYHTCALTSSGGVRCWGENLAGQLGDGTTSMRSTIPVDVIGLMGEPSP